MNIIIKVSIETMKDVNKLQSFIKSKPKIHYILNELEIIERINNE